MPDKQAAQNFENSELVFFIVRLVFSSNGRLHHGELVNHSGELLSWFQRLEQLPGLIADALERKG